MVAVGRIGQSPEGALFARYAARLRPAPIVTELPDGRGGPAEIRRREADLILAALPAAALVIALDQSGRPLDSEALAASLTRWRESGRALCFVIGGAEGLDPAVTRRAEWVLSLGAMTWPHLMVRAMLAEQLYRAQSIAAGHPYHRGERPVPAGRSAP